MASDTPELEELQQFVASPGFERFKAHVESEWGADAQVRKIDGALRELKPGDFDAEYMTVSQIRAAALRIQALVRWPSERIAQLKSAKPKPLASAMDHLRRIAR